MSVPTTSDPPEEPTIVRTASIPLGTTILAQGVSKRISGPPVIPNSNILPFVIVDPAKTMFVPGTRQRLRSPAAQLVGVTQPKYVDPHNLDELLSSRDDRST